MTPTQETIEACPNPIDIEKFRAHDFVCPNCSGNGAVQIYNYDTGTVDIDMCPYCGTTGKGYGGDLFEGLILEIERLRTALSAVEAKLDALKAENERLRQQAVPWRGPEERSNTVATFLLALENENGGGRIAIATLEWAWYADGQRLVFMEIDSDSERRAAICERILGICYESDLLRTLPSPERAQQIGE